MCAKASYSEKAEVKFRHKVNNYKSKHRNFTKKKRNQKASQKLFHKHYCLDNHTVIDDCDFLLLKDVKCISI